MDVELLRRSCERLPKLVELRAPIRVWRKQQQAAAVKGASDVDDVLPGTLPEVG